MVKERESQEASSPEEQSLIYAEQVKLLYQNAGVGLVGTVICAVVLTYLQWNIIPHPAAIIWLCGLLLATVLRLALVFRYRSRPVFPAEAKAWGRWFIAGMTVSGVLWGSTGVFLLPAESTLHQAILFFVLGGLVAGTAGTFSSIKAAFLAFTIPALAPLTLRFFLIGDDIHVGMGGMALLFAMLLNSVSTRIQNMVVTSLRLRFENANLITYLATAKKRAEQLNKDLLIKIEEHKQAEEELKKHRENLEELVEARTAVWCAATEQLQKEIAERKKAEDALKDSEEYFRSIIENALDIITVLDKNGDILFESPSIEKHLGYGQAELIGRNVFEFVHPDDCALAQQALADRIKDPGHSVSVELRFRHANGSWRYFEAVGKSIVDGTNDMRIIVNSRDNTERKKLEVDVLKAQKLESLSTLAGGIAHDYNNIVTGILANIEMAKIHADRKDELLGILQKAELASIRAKDLTQQLLTFSRGGVPVKKAVFIGKFIKEAAGFALRGSKAKCNFTIQADLRPVEVDEGQFRQAIQNVVINADQAMPDGGIITVTAENTALGEFDIASLPAGDYVKISIQDRGVGIPKEHLSNLFDPYFSTKQKASGFGLATSYSIIKRHNGVIAVDSVPGAGTTVILYVPASQKKVEALRKRTDGLVPGHGRVLVMDDEEIIRDAAGLILKTAGYEVEYSKDGNEAIECYLKAVESGRPFDVVILDVTVPGGVGGKETIERLLKINPGVKAVVSSGYSHDPIMAHYLDYGFRGFITKPYTPRDMSEVVSMAMKTNS
jgi:two-component system, cell cycle sensor histidine kinase and response regulator CckA